VRGFVHEGGAVRGVQTTNGVLRAPLVVGADGPHSTVAQLAGAREYHVSAPGRLFIWGYFEGAQWPAGYATLGRVGDIGFLGMPTDAGLHLAGIAVSMSQKETCLADTDTTFKGGIQRVAPLAEYLAPASRVGRLRVMTRWHGYFRQATGPGWVLVGDAGHFKDPTPAQGIADALRQGEKLADAVEAGLGAGGLEDQLRNWWRWRDDDAWEMYWFATDMGAAGENPGIVADMMLGLRNEDGGTERFLRVLNHELLPSELFNPGRLARTLARASIHHPRRALGLVGEARSRAADELKRRRLRKRPRFEGGGLPS
jgi:2-polyprenyl-6-methoxyphenol hydroxylase-like FAD-dependent oxidoreductase